MKILLVDGHNLLFRAFYGIPARIVGKNGEPLHAVVGVIGKILRTLRSEHGMGVIVAFDSESGSFRDRQFSGYKATRVRDFSGIDSSANPFSQLASLKSVLDFLGWKYCEIDGIEADDVIAEYCRALGPDDEGVIVSADNDFLQLVNSRVIVIGSGDRRYAPEDVRTRYGVQPSQLTWYRALIGDQSDNIAGVRGIGPKTAAQLIQKFETLEGIFLNLATLPARQAEVLAEARNRLYETVALTTLNHPVDLPFKICDLGIPEIAPNLRTMTVLRDIGLLA